MSDNTEAIDAIDFKIVGCQAVREEKRNIMEFHKEKSLEAKEEIYQIDRKIKSLRASINKLEHKEKEKRGITLQEAANRIFKEEDLSVICQFCPLVRKEEERKIKLNKRRK